LRAISIKLRPLSHRTSTSCEKESSSSPPALERVTTALPAGFVMDWRALRRLTRRSNCETYFPRLTVFSMKSSAARIWRSSTAGLAHGVTSIVGSIASLTSTNDLKASRP
jgi:hypothetical protein